MTAESPNDLNFDEELALRRIAYGIIQPSRLRLRDVERLTFLGLVEKRGRGLVLTPQGKLRVARLPVRKLDAGPLVEDAYVIALGKVLGTRR